ncbi:MAG: sensor histidine kinase, partial [Myxococcota bacterium]
LAALRVSAFAPEGANDAPAAEVWLVEAPPGEEVWGADASLRVALLCGEGGGVEERTKSLFDAGYDDVLCWPSSNAALEVALVRWGHLLSDIDVRRLPPDHVRALRRLVELTSDSVEITDAQVRLAYVNPAFEQITGYAVGDVVGRTTAELFRANTHDPDFYRGIMRALQDEGVWRGSMIGRRSDGSLSFQEAVLGAFRNAAEEIAGFVALKRDVHRDALTHALREGVEGRIAKAVEASAGALVVHTEDGDVLEANGAAQALFGGGESPRRTLLVDVDSSDAVALRQAWAELREGDTLELEGRVRRADDEFVRVVFRTRRMVVAGELFLVSLILDMTAQYHQREMELARAREESLVDAKEVLTRSLQEKETLLKEVYHRVKNNLQIISSLLTLQSDTVADEQIRASFLESANRVRSMALIHQQLYGGVSLARIELTEYIRELGQALASSSDRQVQLDVQGDVVEVPLEIAVPCGLVLNELLTNAIKYGRSPDGGCVVRALVERSDAVFTMTVRDEGPGFPEDFSARQRRSLGWSLVSSLARQLRAKVDCGNDGGARVSVAIPVSALAETGAQRLVT